MSYQLDHDFIRSTVSEKNAFVAITGVRKKQGKRCAIVKWDSVTHLEAVGWKNVGSFNGELMLPPSGEFGGKKGDVIPVKVMALSDEGARLWMEQSDYEPDPMMGMGSSSFPGGIGTDANGNVIYEIGGTSYVRIVQEAA